MTTTDLFVRGAELDIISIDNELDRITYRLNREKQYSWSDPEEKVRAQAILDLIFNYQYSPKRLDTEVAIPGRTPTNWADVVVFRDDRCRSPYIVVETAAPNTTESQRAQKVEQLFGYANALAAEFAVYSDDASPRRFWRVRGYGGLEREDNVIADVPRNYGDTPEFLYYRSGTRDIEAVDAAQLARVFNHCHNELWSGGRSDPTESFDEMSKLIFAKLYDERHTVNGEPYGFQWGENETDIMVAQRVIDRYESAREDDPGVFDSDILAEPSKIAAVARLLQRVSLSRADADAKGRAFEQFLGEVFRGRLGQYFTRREIVDCLVDMAQPTMDDTLLDPACGSGGFLVYAMKRVFSQIEADYAGDEATISRHKNNFAQQRIYGIEINERIARVSMMDMVINEDGHTNIENGTAFDDSFGNAHIRDGAFSLALTNPPFGDMVRHGQNDKLGQASLDAYELARGRTSAKSESLFIERCARFLRPGGRLGIVLPDGTLSNPSDRNAREYLLSNFQIIAIISLPVYAFRKAGSGMRTSLVVARKWDETDDRDTDYPIFMAIAEHIGYDATARPDSNDLPDIVAHFRNGTGAIEDKIVRVRRRDVAQSQTMRLDTLYHYLGPIIEREFENISYPVGSLGSIVEEPIQSGKSPKGGAKYSVGDVPILLVGNITEAGTLTLDDLNYADEDFYEANRAKAAVNPLDILIAKDGATTGKVGLTPPDFEAEQCLFSEHIFRLSVGSTLPGDDAPNSDEAAALKELNTYYLFFFLKSRLGQQQIARQISGGAQGGITKTFVENIRIPIPPISERARFVENARREYDNYLELTNHAQAQYQRFTDSLSLRDSG